MSAKRKHPRFDVRFADQISARVGHATTSLRLMTLGGGGCAFVGETDVSNWIPPQRVALSFDVFEGQRCLYSKEVMADLIYVRPHNMTQEWLLGFSFGMNDRAAMAPVMSQLEKLANLGLVDRS